VASPLRYTVVLDPDPEGGFTVTVPALPSVVTEGDTLDEALTNAREAIELALEVLAERGEKPPIETGEVRLEHVEVAV
jgi:antitoxin HicB